MKSECWGFCIVCNEPINVGDKCYEIGYKHGQEELICEMCHQSITPYDTVKAYKKLTGDDEDG